MLKGMREMHKNTRSPKIPGPETARLQCAVAGQWRLSASADYVPVVMQQSCYRRGRIWCRFPHEQLGQNAGPGFPMPLPGLGWAVLTHPPHITAFPGRPMLTTFLSVRGMNSSGKPGKAGGFLSEINDTLNWHCENCGLSSLSENQWLCIRF